jgi:hypothetical protein
LKGKDLKGPEVTWKDLKWPWKNPKRTSNYLFIFGWVVGEILPKIVKLQIFPTDDSEEFSRPAAASKLFDLEEIWKKRLTEHLNSN